MPESAAALLERARRPVSLSGAGLSAESGIPTFRDQLGGGLWSQYDPAQLATPQGFSRDPKLVTEWYRWRRKLVADAEPNAGHHALAACAEMVHVTQNVDDLLERAGARNILHLHGVLGRDRCIGGCGFTEAIDMAEPPPLRACPRCGKWLRPGVVWFGETLPTDAWTAAVSACSACEALLVVGTSATVYPAADLIRVAKQAGAKILVVNTATSEASHLADVELIGPAGELLPKILSWAL